MSDGTGNFPAEAAANAVLDYADSHGLSFGPMKLQKLMYFVHGYYLAVTDQPWLNEYFEAWEFGPVLPSIYHEFKEFGAEPISKGARAHLLVRKNSDFTFEVPPPATEEDDTGKRILSFVMDRYGAKSAVYLSDLTHKIGSPWHQINLQYGGKIPKNADIPNDLIRSYFLKLITEK